VDILIKRIDRHTDILSAAVTVFIHVAADVSSVADRWR